MKTKLIQEIFYNIVQQSEEYTEEWGKIVEPLSRKVYDVYIAPLRKTDKSKADEIESDINAEGSAHELLGFLIGFKCAMQLKSECEVSQRKEEV